MISVRTARVAIILCGLTAAIAPIDTGWACKAQTIENRANGEGKGAKYLVNGEPATAAQFKQCEQCNLSGRTGGACAAYNGKEATESKREKANEIILSEQKNKEKLRMNTKNR